MAVSNCGFALGDLMAAGRAAEDVRPLEQDLREGLEARFGRSLAHVRVWTGRSVERAARTVGARAFAFGRDIFFGQGQYEPRTERGLWLLAHEIAHVCQAGRDVGPGGDAALGPADDLWEREADAAADAVLSGGTVPGLTQDVHPRLRRAVEFSDIDMEVRDHLTKPVVSLRVGIGGTQVGFHMSAPWDPNTENTNDALEIEGRMRFKQTIPDELDEWQMGFVQLISLSSLKFHYQGRKPEEGHVLIDALPDVGTAFMLDVNKHTGGRAPFYQRPTFTVVGGVIKTLMQDHPSLLIPQSLKNFKTGYDNFLESVSETLRAMSILTGQPPTGQRRHFAHVQWTTTYAATFFWKDRQILTKLDSSQFDKGPVFMRPPRDSDLAGVSAFLAKLGPQTSPVFNDRLQTALRFVFAEARPTRTDGDQASSPFVENFWR